MTLVRLPIVFALMVSAALAQNVTGSVVGTVKDSTGGVIVAATITLTNQDTNFESHVETNSAGDPRQIQFGMKVLF